MDVTVQTSVAGINLVRSEEEFGCGIACLAMVLGQGYSDVRRNWHTNFNKKGFKSIWYESFLRDSGCSVMKKRLRVAPFVRSAQMCGAMLKPFAPVHIVAIQQCAEWDFSHAVVMDAEGILFDPAGNSHENLMNSIYAVPMVLGIWRPGDHEQ